MNSVWCVRPRFNFHSGQGLLYAQHLVRTRGEIMQMSEKHFEAHAAASAQQLRA
jgi:hypothetical protein